VEALVKHVAVVAATRMAVRWVRRLRHTLQNYTIRWLDQHHADASAKPLATHEAAAETAAPETAAPPRHVTLERWFFLLERYAIITLGLASLYVMGKVVGLGHFTGALVGFTLRVLAMLRGGLLLVLPLR